MTDNLRFMYNPAFFERLCPLLKESIPGFDCRDFIFRVFNNKWPDMGLNERSVHIAKVLHHFLEKDFGSASERLIAIADLLPGAKNDQHPPEYAFLIEYVELFGLDQKADSMEAMRQIKKLTGWASNPIHLQTERYL